MVTLTPTSTRVQRLLRLLAETHEHTGSLSSAVRHTARVMLAKAPMLLRQHRQRAKSVAVARDIRVIRESGGDTRPLIGIRVSGGLGDFLVIARFLRDLVSFAGEFTFDVYSTQPELARWVFGQVGGMRACHDDLLFELTFRDYDLAARISQFIVFHETEARWDRLRPHRKLIEAVANAIYFRPRIQSFIDRHPYMDGFLAQKAVYANRRRADYLHHMTAIPYGGDSLDVDVDADAPRRHGLHGTAYITIHNGFDPGFIVHGPRATKCYPHFGAVVARLRDLHPEMRFVQIGTSTSEAVGTVHLNLLGRTSLLEAAGLIGGAVLHIDNEGGLVHLARCLGIASCVVFGPTPSAYFGYDGNINVDPTFCGGCWWINESWMSVCPRGFPTARCMTEQDPQAVAQAIHAHLARTRTAPARIQLAYTAAAQ